MEQFTIVFNHLSAIASIGFSVAVIIGLGLFFWGNRESSSVRFIERNGILLAFLGALAATIGSLVYSYVIGFVPCELCWLQRIFMFPTTIILGIALWKKDQGIIDYELVLAAIGALIATAHYLYQFTGVSLIPCASEGGACAKRIVFMYNYITIPMMSLASFATIITGLIFARRHNTPPQRAL